MIQCLIDSNYLLCYDDLIRQKEKKKLFKKPTYLWVVVLLLQACTPHGGVTPYDRKGALPVVSASRGTGEYISRGKAEYASYISALDEAREEEVHGKQLKKDPIDAYVDQLVNEAAPVSNIEYLPLKQKALSSIWGKPVDSVGDGVTLMNTELRTRFNDALSTTPMSSQARWRYGDRSFIFMPNSDIFQPYYSGGNCRDGVFVNYIEGREERLRALFCQKGRGADWYLMR
ncbi:MAG: hypothetical protein ACI8QY_000753 [bacterium]|jgi:hypothetical protein